ncbi:sodium:proton antiporter NhaD [Methylomonas sp. MV1]|nr:sodium:proton antiporter NhaD [Methylomonas sp. MV1]MDT4328416.1 sodium:proton antiporter NhaD [Methylomonas sp. MV1]
MNELNKFLLGSLAAAGLMLFSTNVLAETFSQALDLSGHWVGYLCVGLFAIAYLFVVLEEVLELRKSKPMMLAAALIWVAIALVYKNQGLSSVAETAIRHDVLDYGELLLFLIVSIAYINAMEERRVFDSLRAWLVNRGSSYRQLFWVTGGLAFFISSVSNDMTTAMLMCAVVARTTQNSSAYPVSIPWWLPMQVGRFARSATSPP